MLVIQHNADSTPAPMWAARERGPWSAQQLSCPTTPKWSLEPSRYRENNALDLPGICPIFPAEQGSWVMESVSHQEQQDKGDPSPFLSALEMVSYRRTSLAIYKCICPALYTSVYSNFLSKKLVFAVVGPAPLPFPEKKCKVSITGWIFCSNLYSKRRDFTVKADSWN